MRTLSEIARSVVFTRCRGIVPLTRERNFEEVDCIIAWHHLDEDVEQTVRQAIRAVFAYPVSYNDLDQDNLIREFIAFALGLKLYPERDVQVERELYQFLSGRISCLSERNFTKV